MTAGKTEVESTSTQVLANANASLDRCAVFWSGLPIFLAIQLRLFLPQREIPQLNPKRKRDSLYIILPIQTKFSSSILSELTTSHSKTWSSLHYSLTVLQENEVEHKEPIIQREQLDLPFTSQSEGKKFLFKKLYAGLLPTQ